VILGALWYWDSRNGSSVVDDERYGIVELPPVKNATGQPPVAEAGRAAPDFLLETPGGGELRLSDLQGQPVLVNFWATWCPPCRDEMPELVRAYDEHEDEGLVIVGVNLQEPDGAVEGFASEFGVDFPLVIDRDAEVADAWRLGGPFEGIPSSYLIDDRGVVQEIFYGPMDEDELGRALPGILAGTEQG
jgi:peroxiredoxin